jgi:hypothetical protein
MLILPTGIGENWAKNILECSVKNKTLFERVHSGKLHFIPCEFVLFSVMKKYSAQFSPSLDFLVLFHQGKTNKKEMYKNKS